jgi:hypothetical protein
MNTACRMMTISLCLALAQTCRVFAMAPPYVTDEELAAYPIIVVAKWDKAPAKSHNQYRDDDALGQVVVKSEVYTSLNVLEVIKGNIEPGVHELIIDWGISWREDGTWLTSGTSTEISGDVKDVTEPCLWFLEQTRSWDETRKTDYLTVSNYREVQPLPLKTFFVALGKSNRTTEVPRLLTANDPLVSDRVLRYLCGGKWPWPYGADERFGDYRLTEIYTTPTRRGLILFLEADRVWDLITSDEKELRGKAASVYAELKGKDCVPKMRTLLDDEDPAVRGVAVGILASYHDVASLDRFPQAVEGVEDAALACKLIKVLSSWGDERVALPMISYLQNGGFAYQYGNDFGIPALKARQALKAITGHVFPFDVEVSKKAWQQALPLEDRTARLQLLAKVAPGDESPFFARAAGEPRTEADEKMKERFGGIGEDDVFVTIGLYNLSPRPVTVLKYPSDVEMSWPEGNSSYRDRSATKEDFTTIDPGEAITFEVRLYRSFLRAGPSKRLRLQYLNNGHEAGVNAWIGTVLVTFGSE